MGKAFTDREKEAIKKQLITCAGQLIAKKGMKNITIDELVKPCHIAKGSFYHFYAAKELLFWDVVMQWHNQIDEEMNRMVNECETIDVDRITDLITTCYLRCFQIGLGTVLVNGEIEYLMRSLPEEIIQTHILQDDDMVSKLIQLIPQADPKQSQRYAAAFRGVFLFLMFKDQIGDDFEAVLRLTVRGIVIQMLREE